MHPVRKMVLAGTTATVVALGACSTQSSAPANPMTFFVTSVNPGKGADFGGLPGADAHCAALASKAGAPGRNWRAYLSTNASTGATMIGGSSAINARDRIGKGPWVNVKGELVASNVDELHGSNKIAKLTALTEKGDVVSGRGDAVNLHDILTGSTPEGRAMPEGKDNTCRNWTSSGEGSAIVGHHDRTGLDESAPAKSWNSSHATRGCGLDQLKTTGGAGLLYCFAAN
ncbi:MAG: hypothetical protein ACOYNZ_14735 [Rhodoferax sp.]